MSDQKLRELERRWNETGAVEDEAAYLRERVRVGELSQRQLELAAYCGHPAALLVCGLEEESYYPPHAATADLSSPGAHDHFWSMGLERWGAGVEARAAVEAVKAVMHLWESWPGTREDLRPRAYLTAVEDWLRDGTPAMAMTAAAVSAQGGRELPAAPNRVSLVLSAAYDLAGVPVGRDAEDARLSAGGSLAYAAIAGAMAALAEASVQGPEAQVRARISAALIGWALRHSSSDPIEP